MKKLLFISLGTFIAIFFVLPPLAIGADSYKVGALFSVTGRASFVGDPEKKTVVMLVDQINKAGGINGKKLEVILYDTEGDSTKTRLFFRKLVNQDKVCAVIGPSLSGTSLAIVDEAKRLKTPLVSCAASYKIVYDDKTKKQRTWVFKTPQTDTMGVEANYSHLKKRGINKIALITITSGFGKSGRQELLRLAPKYGMNIVADEIYGLKDQDLTAQLTNIKATGAKAICNWGIGPSSVVLMRNWQDLGMTNIPLYREHAFGNLKNIELAAGAAEGVHCPLGPCNIATLLPKGTQRDVCMKFVTDYEAKYNEPIATFSGHAWDALMLVVKAMKAAGCDKKNIRNELENTKNFVGQHGVFNFSADDHVGLNWKQSFTMVKVLGDSWAPVD
jgi:branched-chain amino acid transport system substrate-binding protein